jgi:hypothetical protein
VGSAERPRVDPEAWIVPACFDLLPFCRRMPLLRESELDFAKNAIDLVADDDSALSIAAVDDAGHAQRIGPRVVRVGNVVRLDNEERV